MTSWDQAIDRLFVQPERLVWLWIVFGAALAIVVGELLRVRWRRRLFALASDPRVATRGEPRRWMLSAVRIIALLLVVLALADPRAGLGAIEVEVKASKLQIVCLLDRSRSMRARDVPSNRFEAGRNVVRDVVDSAGGAAVALVTFAGDARIDVPLTRDYHGLLDRLDAITPDENQATGSNLATGLATAATCFAERIESPKVFLVITDGETHGMEPVLPDNLLPAGTEVLVVGVGDSQQGARIPVMGADRLRSSDPEFLTHEGEIVWSKADLELLERLAKQLDGRFQKLDAAFSTASVIDVLRRAESTTLEETHLAYRRQAAPRFHWFLLTAVGLLCLEMLFPSKSPASFSMLRFAHPGWAKQTMAWILFSVLTTSVASAAAAPVASPRTARQMSQLYNRGVEAYRAGRWSDAESLFRMVSQQAEGSLKRKATFNLGNTHYAIVNRGRISKHEAIGRLKTAIELYRQVIAEGERAEDARANIEIVYRRLLQIQQQQADAEDDEPPPADDTPDNGNGSEGEADDQDEKGTDEKNGTQSNEKGEAQPDGQGSGDQPQENGSPGENNGPGSGEPDASDSSGSGPSDAGGPSDELTEPLKEQQAEDQLNRIRQRAQDRRKENENGVAPTAAPAGLPW